MIKNLKPYSRILVLILLVIPEVALSQPAGIDSLLHGKSIREQITLLNEISEDYRNQNPLLARPYSVKAVELAAMQEDSLLLALSLKNLGILYYLTSSYDSAMLYFRHSGEIYRQRGDSAGWSNILNNIAISAMIQSQYDTALVLLEKSLRIKQALKDTLNMVKSLKNIGNCYNYQGNYEQALDYYRQAVELNRITSDTLSIIGLLIGMGAISESQDMFREARAYYHEALSIAANRYPMERARLLRNLALVNIETGKHHNALQQLFESLMIREKTGDRQGMALTLNLIGKVYELEGNLDRANELYIQSLQISEEIGDLREVSTTLNLMGQNLFRRQKPADALEYYRKSLEIALKAGLKLEASENFKQMAIAFGALYQPDSALVYLDRFEKQGQSLDISDRELNYIEKSAPDDPHDAEAEEITVKLKEQAKNLRNILNITWIISLIIIAGLTMFIFLLFAFLLSKKQQRKKIYRKHN